MQKITMVELIARTYSWYDEEVKSLEAKRDGNPDREELINQMQAAPKEKMETLMLMYEIETGKKMFVE